MGHCNGGHTLGKKKIYIYRSREVIEYIIIDARIVNITIRAAIMVIIIIAGIGKTMIDFVGIGSGHIALAMDAIAFKTSAVIKNNQLYLE